ncbi:hypothetical protein NI467_06370 [Acinetobacter bohemicus]|uniref:Uncharacterized protein n=1 Tax=Acinetobacter lwoffii TaxID=28090 RepID=A0A9D2UUV9_ACILW|nr:hypothetical protein [Acinetobacter sp. S4397-1]MCO8044981.1 hypothetical protein [Acinetobacter sp. S4397-1]HJF29110.1 hypothetical protein [Acinetobacter lwoffii]
MKQESNKRLYFTDDFSPANVTELQAQGYILRKASAYHESDTLEACAEVAGDVPQAYLDLIARNKANIVTANVRVGITPELQAVIDEAKSECEKVVAENAELKDQLDKERQAATKLMSENSELKDKLLIAEKALVAADEEIKALKAAAKKPTAAELKAIKAAEEATKAEQLKD